jgi:hypothetical protein
MTSFSSELGVKFEASLEAPHVIDIDSQVWATSLLSLKLTICCLVNVCLLNNDLFNTGVACYNPHRSW